MNRYRLYFAISAALTMGNALLLDRHHPASVLFSVIGMTAGVCAMIGFYKSGIK